MCFQHIHRHKHEASNHNPSVPNSSVANLCDVLPTYTSSQAFDPNQTVSNSSGIHPLSMDQAPPRDPPRSNAPNHPRIQNTNVERPKRYSFWKYCDNLEDAKKQRIVEILYGKTHVMVRGTQRRHCNAKQTQRRWIQYIEDISNGLERQTMEDKDWKNKEKAKI
eukprot:343175_1